MNLSAHNKSKINNGNTYWGDHHNWYWKGLLCHWRINGDPNDPPIVLIHGFGASSEHWRNNEKDFVDAGFCVYGLDLIGFGKSEQPIRKKVKSLDNRFWAKQLASFLDQIVLKNKSKKAILIGNSLGGLVALTTFTFRPDLVKAIIAAPLPDPVLINQNLLINSKWRKAINDFLIKIFFYLLPLEIIVPLISRTNLIYKALQLAYFKSIESDASLKRLVKEPAKKSSAARSLRAMAIGMSTRAKSSTAPDLLNKLYQNLRNPLILLVWGREDKFIPLSVGENLKKQYPWIKLLVIDQCGHCPHDESPNSFNRSVLNWLEIHLNSL